MGSYTYEIKLSRKPLFWLGDRFYKVNNKNKKYGNSYTRLSSKCPSCNDTRKITYKGCDGKVYESECPLCKGATYRGYGNTIDLCNWNVNEYIVYDLDTRGMETESAYKDGAVMETVQLTAFCKTGRCLDDYITTNVPFMPDKVDVDITSLDFSKSHFNPDDYIFRKRADAVRFYNVIKEYDKQILIEFNKTYGTDYEYPYK